MLDMITLVVGGAPRDGWEPLVERAQNVAQGQELIELLELAGLTAQRRGDPGDARRWCQEAGKVGERIPNVMSTRIQQRLADLR